MPEERILCVKKRALTEMERGMWQSDYATMRQKLTVSIRKYHRRILRNLKEIPGEFWHIIVVGDVDKKEIRNVVRKTHIKGEKKFAETELK